MESNNINETLGIENSEKKITDNKELNSDELFRDENRLKGVADFVLIAGIISAVILFFTTAIVTIKGEYSFQNETLFSWAGFVTVITTLLFTIGVWAFLRVISNISITLKDIKKLKTM